MKRTKKKKKERLSLFDESVIECEKGSKSHYGIEIELTICEAMSHARNIYIYINGW